MNMCLLEVAMSEKCRSNHFESEGGEVEFEDWGVTFAEGGGQYPITCHVTICECSQTQNHIV